MIHSRFTMHNRNDMFSSVVVLQRDRTRNGLLQSNGIHQTWEQIRSALQLRPLCCPLGQGGKLQLYVLFSAPTLTACDIICYNSRFYATNAYFHFMVHSTTMQAWFLWPSTFIFGMLNLPHLSEDSNILQLSEGFSRFVRMTWLHSILCHCWCSEGPSHISYKSYDK